jgi:site-specific recombinase XerD
MTLIAPTLQAFFTDRLGRQRQASPRTIAAYRDTMRLLLTFVHQHGGKPPSMLDWDDLTADVISAFLNHLEDERGNSARTRNVRLTAIRSLFSFAALHHPEHALLIARVLDIPPKRFDKRIVTFLTAEEGDALLAATDPGRWEGRRDKAMMALAVQTGLRVSELTSLNCADITLGDGAAVRCEGKGRKQRAVPLDRPVRQLLRGWLDERSGGPRDPLFCTRSGRRLSRDADLPVPARKERPPARPASQLCHVAAAGRRRHHRHRALAWPRRRPLHRRLRPRRHDHQGKSPGPHHTGHRQAGPLPSHRQDPRVPRQPVTSTPG